MIGRFEPTVTRARQTLARFESAGEYARACEARADATGGEASVTDGHSTEWTGAPTLASAVRLGIDGWAEGRDKVEKLTGGLVASLAGRIMREEWVPDVEGHYIDVPLFLEGEPECWRRPEEVYSETGTARRHVRILFNGTVSGGVPVEVINARGAALAALVDLLELAGHAVTLDLVHSSGRGEVFSQIVALKPANERADLAKLMFWLAHPSALRRMAFAYWEGLSQADRQKHSFVKHGGYGQCQTPYLDEAERPDVYIGEGNIGTPEGRGLWTDLAATKKWLSATLAELGVRIAE